MYIMSPLTCHVSFNVLTSSHIKMSKIIFVIITNVCKFFFFFHSMCEVNRIFAATVQQNEKI